MRERAWLGHDEEESDEETGYEVADEDETRDDETDGRTANWGSELVFFCIYGASYVSLGPCMLRVNREEPEVLEIAGMWWKVSECVTGSGKKPGCSCRFYAWTTRMRYTCGLDKAWVVYAFCNYRSTCLSIQRSDYMYLCIQ